MDGTKLADVQYSIEEICLVCKTGLKICITVIEYIVYCGIDDEYKKIGALHVLTGLTGVSLGARTSLPWLYESLYG